MMSLKSFHIFFISICLLLCLVTGAWVVRQYVTDGSGASWIVATFSAGGFVGLIVYFRWFLKTHSGKTLV